MNTKWNAKKYTEDFSFVPAYGKELIELINAPKGSAVLDLGCGGGDLTYALSEEGYEVIGLDMSEELLQVAKKRYPGLSFLKADATEFSLSQPVDAIFSNAVFHWIKEDEQKNLLTRIFQALKPGGELVFECGGYGNNAIIHRRLEETFNEDDYIYTVPFYFPSIATYATLLEETGFLVVYARLFERPTPLRGEDGLKEWIDMFIREPFVGLDEEIAERIKRQAINKMRKELYKKGCWYADYVRLRMRAIKV